MRKKPAVRQAGGRCGRGPVAAQPAWCLSGGHSHAWAAQEAAWLPMAAGSTATAKSKGGNRSRAVMLTGHSRF